MNSIKEKVEKMRKCDHLFVIIEHGNNTNFFHSSDCGNSPHIVKCLNCSLTNYGIEKENFNKQYQLDEYDPDIQSYLPEYCLLALETKKEFIRQFKHAYRRGGKEFDNSVFKLISEEEIGYHTIKFDEIEDVYNEAKSINPEGSNSELFDLMKEIGKKRKQENKPMQKSFK